MVRISMTVNATLRTHDVEPRLLLVHYLLDVLVLTGTHVGCDTSQCGACVVHLNGDAVKSCTMFAVQAEGSQVTTIEGLATNGELHPVQEGFWEEHGLQCGFCTPGFLMLSTALLREKLDPTEEEVREVMSSNLCRCTGYQGIIEAVLNAAGKNGGMEAAVDEAVSRDTSEDRVEGVSPLREAGDHDQ